MNKKLFILIFVSGFIFSVAHGLWTVDCYASTIDKIIVVVNGETITKSELDMAIATVAEKVRKESTTEEEFNKQLEEYKKQILDRMIEEKLILSEAKKKGIKAEDPEIDGRLEEVKANFESEENFKQVLREEDVSLRDLKQRYADQIIIAKLADMEIRQKIKIAPSELSAYYDAHKEEFTEEEQIRVKNMLIKPQSDDKKEEAEQLAEKILGFLKAGEGFDELALKYSKGPNADMGGDLGFVKRGQMKKEIDDVIFNLNSGDLSGVIKTDLGYHIFKVEEKLPNRTKVFSETKGEIEKILYAQKGKELYQNWIEGLKKNAYISYR